MFPHFFIRLSSSLPISHIPILPLHLFLFQCSTPSSSESYNHSLFPPKGKKRTPNLFMLDVLRRFLFPFETFTSESSLSFLRSEEMAPFSSPAFDDLNDISRENERESRFPSVLFTFSFPVSLHFSNRLFGLTHFSRSTDPFI